MDIDIRPRRYKKDLSYSYTFGVFPTLELLQYQPHHTVGVFCHSKGEENSGVKKIKTLCQENKIPFEIQDRIFSRVGARGNDYTIGIFKKFEKPLSADTDHVVLVNPSGMGNLGTILRTMLGFDFQDLAIIQPAADIFHPETIRASMGAFFQLRVGRFENFDSYKMKFSRQYLPLMVDGEIEIQKALFESPFSLIFGNESSGLPAIFHSSGRSVKIRQSEKIDSFNIAISVGICLYEARGRKRN